MTFELSNGAGGKSLKGWLHPVVVGRGGALAAVVLALLALPDAGAEPTASLPPGPLYLEGPLLVPENDTLLIGPGTFVSGPGRIEVWGSLEVRGSPGSLAELSVPVLLRGNGTSRFEHARLWGVNATALVVSAGSAELSNVTVEASGRGVQVEGNGSLRAADVALTEHDGEALYATDGADVELRRAVVRGNGRGATVFGFSRLLVEDSSFADNGQHVVIDLGPWSRAGEAPRLVGNDFGATAPGGSALFLRHESAGSERVVEMARNVVHDAPVGLRAQGEALVVESRNDTFRDNQVGLAVQGAKVRLRGATLGNAEDIQGGGDLLLEDVTYVRAADAPAPAPRAGFPGAAWVALGVVGLVAVGLLLLRGPRAPPQRVPAAAPDAEPVEPAPPPEPPADLALKPLERRVLEDVLAHPGTSQRAVADRLGMTRQALHYHVKKLEARGLLAKTAKGRETLCEVPPQVAAAVRALPPSPPPVNDLRSPDNP